MIPTSVQAAVADDMPDDADDDRDVIVASFLLRECGSDVAAAQRAVRRAKANVDAEVAAIERKAGAS